jgi:hypothetical protein
MDQPTLESDAKSVEWMSKNVRFGPGPKPWNGCEDSLTNRYLKTHLGIQNAEKRQNPSGLTLSGLRLSGLGCCTIFVVRKTTAIRPFATAAIRERTRTHLASRDGELECVNAVG